MVGDGKKREILGLPPFGARFFCVWATLWAMTHNWPNLDWPKLDLAKIGRAKSTMAKNGFAQIGQIRMAKTGLAKVGPFRRVCQAQDFENQKAQDVEEVQLGRVLREVLRSLDGVDVGHLFFMRAVLMKSPPAFVTGAYRAGLRIALKENVVTKLGVCVDGSCSCWSHECCCSVLHEVD